MKLGYIDYLNCYPYYYNLFEKKPIPGVEIIRGYPGQLNKMMIDGTLDISPVSAAVYPDILESTYILPDFSLSSIGYVGSVILESRLPIEELHNKKVGITAASKTSAVLLKILMKKYFEVEPVYTDSGPNPTIENNDALLVIGNDAIMTRPDPLPYRYDLGDLWMRKTGFPVVFAIFTVKKSIIEEKKELINKIIFSYNESLEFMKSDRETMINKAKEKYPDIQYDIDFYYNTLQFHFDDDLKKAFEFYLKSASELGLLKEVDGIEYYGE